MVNAEQITIAREFRGVSQTTLSKEVGVTQGTLSKIENGIAECDPSLLKKLSETLNFPVSFFEYSGRSIGEPMSLHTMFRRRASSSKKALDRVTAEINIRLQNLKTLLKSVDFEPELVLPRYDIEDFDGSAEDIAKQVRKAWLCPKGPIVNLTDLVERAGIAVFYGDYSFAKVDGVSVSAPGVPPAVFLNKHNSADRSRFSLAHELGHLVMHRQPSTTMEEEADLFASSLLLPKSDFIASCRGSRVTLAELARLKSVWKVSMQAILYRMKQLHVVTPNQATYLWKQMSTNGYRKKEPAITEFPREEPYVLNGLKDIFIKELGYSYSEFSQVLNLSSDDLMELYNFTQDVEKPKLRIVR